MFVHGLYDLHARVSRASLPIGGTLGSASVVLPQSRRTRALDGRRAHRDHRRPLGRVSRRRAGRNGSCVMRILAPFCTLAIALLALSAAPAMADPPSATIGVTLDPIVGGIHDSFNDTIRLP